MKVFLFILISNLVTLPTALQASIKCTDENLPKNLPNYEDLRSCSVSPGSDEVFHSTRVIQIGSLEPRILELSEFMELRYWGAPENPRYEYTAKAVNSVLFELLKIDKFHQDGLQKKLRRIQFNADSNFVAALEKWVKILSVQNYIKNELGPAFDYLEDYKNFLENNQITNNKQPTGRAYWLKAKGKIDLLRSYSTYLAYCAFDDLNCRYSDKYSLFNFTPLEPNFPYLISEWPLTETLVRDIFLAPNRDAFMSRFEAAPEMSSIAPEMSSIMSSFDKVWGQRVSIQNAVINNWTYPFEYTNCADGIHIKFTKIFDSKFPDPGSWFLEKPNSYYSDSYPLKRLNDWVDGTNKIIKHIEQTIFEFNDILSQLDVIEKDQQGFLSSWRILSQDIINRPDSPSDLISYLKVENLTLPQSSIYVKNTILAILKSTEKVKYIYGNDFLSVFNEVGVRNIFRKLMNSDDSDYESVLHENRYHFRTIVEQLRFDESRIKKYKQKFLGSEDFYKTTNEVVNLELEKLRFYKSLQREMGQCQDE